MSAGGVCPGGVCPVGAVSAQGGRLRGVSAQGDVYQVSKPPIKTRENPHVNRQTSLPHPTGMHFLFCITFVKLDELSEIN